MKNILLLFLLLLAPLLNGVCQEFTLPEYTLADAKDYEKYENDVKKAMQWVIKTPVDKTVENREDIQKFVLRWVRGAPEIKLQVRRPFIDPLLSSSSEFLYGSEMMLKYLSSMAMHQLNASENPDELSCQMAGITSMIEANKQLSSDEQSSFLQKLAKKQERQKLKKWVRKKIK